MLAWRSLFSGITKHGTLAPAMLAALGTLLAAGCGGGHHEEFIVCETETRAMPYRAGLTVTSDADLFTVELVSSVPGPPIKGRNTWIIEVDQASSNMPLADLDLEVTPWMPDHLHGTTPVVVSPDATPGQYQLQPVYLYMSGFWQVRLTIAAPNLGGGTIDTAIIPVCIP